VPELRRDPVVDRWVIIASERARRPSDFAAQSVRARGTSCVFCAGHESETPPEVLAGGPPERRANGPGWTFRVVPNKYPALRVEGDLEPSGEGIFDRMNGIGAHEVIIETPEHAASLATLPTERVADVLGAFHARLTDLKKDPRFRYVLVFKNHGEAAGASLEHPHCQLIATPIIPVAVSEELAGAARYFALKERCVWCDMIRQERRDGRRLVVERDGFVVLAPFAPRSPFETWILPTRHQAAYEDSGPEDWRGLAAALGECLRRLGTVLRDPPYNFVLHGTPLHDPPVDSFHWHLEIVPKLTRMAGFELGSGVWINSVPPEDAAEALRGAPPEGPVVG
jgi:UDPglucose--hexose-1-phosphate uridylyltransferase